MDTGGGTVTAPSGYEARMYDDTHGRRRCFAEAARDDRPDLALLCLLIATEAQGKPGEETVDAAQMELDRLAGLLPALGRQAEPRRWAQALAELLGQRCDFHGSPADYRRLESSLLDEVLRRRRGLPILLSVVWIEVARRAGAPVYGVALPGHFVVGFGDPRGHHVLADPFEGGRVLSEEDASLLVAGATGAPLSPAMFSPAQPLEIVLRVLNNIRAWAAARPERSDVQLWAVELSLLLPTHPARLRYERAELLVERGDFARGARELEEYADVIAPVEPTVAESVRHQALAARAMLN
ncbi:regulator of sirC expression with transglutaminase-like and TPR domain [Streptomyces olivoverticillatus]|uniref:Regulator of sirC expression with transglutaminase-like and TPR domain n=2 Tax=Streptomyces olivoverticillatus TaxID=66427 RepID=A0A7W7LJP3_9ACTN|nr:regulator of sirC expression with transglutaminase-like and TPR domain [Streptomyces olivoverticillatus]